MNCIHKPANYRKLLMEGDEGMVCRHCNKPIRTKDPKRAGTIRRLWAFIPMIIFLIIVGTDISEMLPGKMALVYCFIVCTGITILGWLIVCRFGLEYEEVPEEASPETNNAGTKSI